MARLQDMRKRAKAAGVPSSAIRAAESVSELEALIEERANGTKSRKVAKKAVKVAKKKLATKKRGRPVGSKNKPKVTEAPKKRGRPKASTKKATPKRAVKADSDGRHMLGTLDFNAEGWNPREDSLPDLIIKAAKKAKGNREKAFEILVDTYGLGELVPKKTRTGRTRTKAEQEADLRYRIASTLWRFAILTGQHEAATERAAYGTAGTGEGKFKRAKKATQKASKATRAPAKGRSKATARSGRKSPQKRTRQKARR